MATKKRLRSAATLLLSAAAAASLLLVMSSGYVPGTAAAEQLKTKQDEITASCNTYYFALDSTQTKANPEKVSSEDLGPRGDASSVAKAQADLDERRECGTDGKYDTELLATQYAAWSEYGFTSVKVPFSEIDAFRARLNSDKSFYQARLEELKSLESQGNATLGKVSKGVWSVYALPNGKGDLTTHIGKTGSNGTTLKFSYKGKTIQYRLECGFQIVRPSQMPGLPPCDYNDCGPKPVTPTTPTTPPTPNNPTCTSNCGTTHTPTCEEQGQHGTYPKCYWKDSSNKDPYVQGNAPTGGGKNADPGPGTYVPPSQTVQPPTTKYTPPAAPVGGSSSSGGSAGGTGGTTVQPSPDPAPAPSSEPSAPTSSAPETSGSSCPAGVPSC